MFNRNLSRRRVGELRRSTRTVSGSNRLHPRPGRIRSGTDRRSTAAAEPVAEQIRDFLAGRTEGEALLQALYNPILDEPIPPRLRRLLRS